MSEDPLWKTIQSLTKSEKRYFRMYANLQSSNQPQNYLRIFDLLAAQTVYDKEALQKALVGEKILERLSSEKNYLFRVLLKSMRAFHAANSTRGKIRGWIQDAVFLYDKSVYPASAKLFKKARLKAIELEDDLILIEILAWESKLAKLIHKKDLGQELSRIIREGEFAANRLQRTQDLHRLYNRCILTVYLGNKARETKAKTTLQEITNASALQYEPRGFEARHLFFQIQSLNHQLTGDYEAAYQSQSRLVMLWENHEIQQKASPTRYKQVLSNTVQLCLNLKRLGDIPPLMAQVRKYPSESVHDEIQVEQITLFNELLYYLNVGDFESLQQLIPEIKTWLLHYGELISESRKIAFISNLALYFFLADRPKEALEWAHRTMDLGKSAQRMDIQYFARIMHLLLHFELGNYKLLEYLTRSTYRYLYRQGTLYNFERAILSHLRKLLALPPEEEKRANLSEMAHELSLMAEDPLVSEAPGVEEVLIWVHSKCNGIGIREQYLSQVETGQ